MAEVLLFHHALGLTTGCIAFADELRAAGHIVHIPDLYEGNVFDDIDEGVAYAKETGFGAVRERGRLAAEDLPAELVYAGFSLGVMPAQELAQTRSGAKGAVLLDGAVPPSEFGEWPDGVPVQFHMMEDDEWVDEDIVAAREMDEKIEGAELFLYPGDKHLFADNSLPSYNENAASLAKQRVLSFLADI